MVCKEIYMGLKYRAQSKELARGRRGAQNRAAMPMQHPITKGNLLMINLYASGNQRCY